MEFFIYTSQSLYQLAVPLLKKNLCFQPLFDNQPKTSSQLTEILQVGSVVFELSSTDDDEFKVQLTSENISLCTRCRRFGVMEGSDICSRCTDVLDSPLNALKHSFF